MSANVIRATRMFAKKGEGLTESGKVSLVKELSVALGFGLVGGFFWQRHHWAECKSINQYYYDLEKANKQRSS